MGIVLYFMLKRLSKPIIIEKIVEKRIIDKFSDSSIERAVREGMKSALREMESEKDYENEMLASQKNANENMGIYTSSDENDEPVKRSGGNLVPFGLNDEEKKVLEMFYRD